MIYSPSQFLQIFASLLERHAEANIVQVLFLHHSSILHENETHAVDNTSFAVSVRKASLFHIQVQFGCDESLLNSRILATDARAVPDPSRKSFRSGASCRCVEGKKGAAFSMGLTNSTPACDFDSPRYSSLHVLASYHVVGSRQQITMYWCGQLQRLWCTRVLLLSEAPPTSTHTEQSELHAYRDPSSLDMGHHGLGGYIHAPDVVSCSRSRAMCPLSAVFRVELPGLMTSPMVWSPLEDGFFGSHLYYVETMPIERSRKQLDHSPVITDTEEEIEQRGTAKTVSFSCREVFLNPLPKEFPLRMAIVLNAALPPSDTHLVVPGQSFGVAVLHAPSLHLCTADFSLPLPLYSSLFSSDAASPYLSETWEMGKGWMHREGKVSGKAVNEESRGSSPVVHSNLSSSPLHPSIECGGDDMLGGEGVKKDSWAETFPFSSRIDSLPSASSSPSSSAFSSLPPLPRSSLSSGLFDFMTSFTCTYILPRIQLHSSIGATWRNGCSFSSMKEAAAPTSTIPKAAMGCSSADAHHSSSSSGRVAAWKCLSPIESVDGGLSMTAGGIGGHEDQDGKDKKLGVYGIGNFSIADVLKEHQGCCRVQNIVLLLDIPLHVWHSLYKRCARSGRTSMLSLESAASVSPRFLAGETEPEELAAKVAGAITIALGRVASKNMDMFAFSRVKVASAIPVSDREEGVNTSGSSRPPTCRIRCAYTNDMLRHSIAESITKILFASSNAKFMRKAEGLLWGHDKSLSGSESITRKRCERNSDEMDNEEGNGSFPQGSRIQQLNQENMASERFVRLHSFSEVCEIIEGRLQMKSE